MGVFIFGHLIHWLMFDRHAISRSKIEVCLNSRCFSQRLGLNYTYPNIWLAPLTRVCLHNHTWLKALQSVKHVSYSNEKIHLASSCWNVCSQLWLYEAVCLNQHSMSSAGKQPLAVSDKIIQHPGSSRLLLITRMYFCTTPVFGGIAFCCKHEQTANGHTPALTLQTQSHKLFHFQVLFWLHDQNWSKKLTSQHYRKKNLEARWPSAVGVRCCRCLGCHNMCSCIGQTLCFALAGHASDGYVVCASHSHVEV